MSRTPQEYPKMVYGPGNAQLIVKSGDDIPEGYMSFHEKHRQGYTDSFADAAVGAIITNDGSSKRAHDEMVACKEAAAKAKQELADAETTAAAADEERMHRDRLKAQLNEHNVDFKPQSGTPKLESLVAQLREHLDAQEAPAAGSTDDTDQ